VRLCDGAIVVVDVVEGVQPQTKIVLQQVLENHNDFEYFYPIFEIAGLERGNQTSFSFEQN